MISKELNDIKKADLVYLKENEILEDKTLEYKEYLNFDNREDKKEFLADVSSFANSMGGDLIYGIKEKDGFPKEISGIKVNNLDSFRNKIENLLRDAIKPRIPSLNIQPILLENGNYVIIIRTKKSWLAPHQVVLDGLLYSRENCGRFYKRHNGGKHPMDVYELRDAFMQSETLYEKISKFRNDRVDNILQGETPIPINEGLSNVVLHIIPLNSFYTKSEDYFNLHKCYTVGKIFKPIYFTLGDDYDSEYQIKSKYNFDGIVKFHSFLKSYIQIYRNGIIEATYNRCFYTEDNIFGITDFEHHMIKSISYYLRNYREFNIEPPFVIFISLLEIGSYEIKHLETGYSFHHYIGSYKSDRNLLILPEIFINDYNIDVESQLKPYFDMVWNAYGIPQSLNYNKDVKWSGNY
ncbi:MAG: ATP-binding protein [Candidatus Cloacimonetes bacterium]|nr:ATP-binding protein [Candidatus Cloacimonadota bacterium]